MNYFKGINYTTLNEKQINKIKQFAEDCVKTNYYGDTKQHNIYKIERDIFIGKAGEEAVKKVFLSYISNNLIKGPDYNIYDKKNKSWEEDLFIDGVGLGVKTQIKNSADAFDLSWLFQKDSEKGRRDVVLDKPDAFVCFVLYTDQGGEHSFYVYPPTQIKNLNFKDPKKEDLIGYKSVVYARDLNHVKDNFLV